MYQFVKVTKKICDSMLEKINQLSTFPFKECLIEPGWNDDVWDITLVSGAEKIHGHAHVCVDSGMITMSVDYFNAQAQHSLADFIESSLVEESCVH